MLEHLYIGSQEQAFRDILALYDEKHRGVVSFLYFANVMHHRLLEPKKIKNNEQYTKIEIRELYKQSLETADILLPDGIALQLFYYRGRSGRKRPTNLNGTDFIPYFLQQLREMTQSIHLAVYSVYDPKIGKSPEELDKASTYISDHMGIDVAWSQQSLYSERGQHIDREAYQKSLLSSESEYRILLVCTGTPHQEIRVDEHRDFFEEHHILVFNAGGLIDYLSGFEKRAPKRVVRMKILETPWRILQHPQKNFKKLWWMFGIIRYRWGRMFY